MEMTQPFAVMAKPVGSRCNMRCSYCYYLEKGQYSSHEKQSRMSFGLLERLIRQYIEASPGPVVSFTWHGGEPTLAGMDFYKKALELEHRYLPSGWQVWNNLQTNGILLNDAWCRFLKENHFDVGLSIDGSEAVHNKNRRDRGGNPTYDKVVRAAERLKQAGIMPDLLCTVNSATLTDPVGVYEGLKRLGTGWIQFIPIVVRLEDGSMAPESVTPEGYGDFLCQVFDQWVRNDLGRLDVQLFAETARVLAGGEASVCYMAPVCGRVLIVEEDGAVYACDHFVDGEHRIGNLQQGNLGTMVDSEQQIRFGRQKMDALTQQCRECVHLPLCRGGCLKDRFDVSRDNEPGQSYLCAGLEKFFTHATVALSKMIDLSRQGKSAEEIMKSFQ
ncbi:MAG: anaerobic sulfatase maturase [Oscillospiraceae bacterium]|nr:anaerobic sulfatase maturase [Oscillospiraceae bacterium]